MENFTPLTPLIQGWAGILRKTTDEDLLAPHKKKKKAPASKRAPDTLNAEDANVAADTFRRAKKWPDVDRADES